MVIDEEDAVERQVVVQREEGQGRDGLVDAAELVEAVDRVSVDDVTTFDVIFGATLEGSIEKRITFGEGSLSCLVERIALTRRGDVTRVTSMQLMTSSSGERLLLVSTEDEVLRLPVSRCERFRTQQ